MLTPMDLAHIWGPPRREGNLDGHIRPEDRGWSMVDGNSMEIEGAELLWATVRYIKPLVVVETGTYFGFAAACIALALQQNGLGHLWSVEIDADNVVKATDCLQRADVMSPGLQACVTVVHGDSLSNVVVQQLPAPIDLLLIDGGDREGEYWKYLERLSLTGLALFHDAGKQKEVYTLVKDLGGVVFSGARGIGVC